MSLDPSTEYRRIQELIDLTENIDLKLRYIDQQTAWVRLMTADAEKSAQQEILGELRELPARIASAMGDKLPQRLRSRMTSLPETPESARTPPAFGDVSHHHKVATADSVPYVIHHDGIDETFYLDKIESNFKAAVGTMRYKWIRSPGHFLLKDYSQKGVEQWVYKRNRNIINARNTLLELHSCFYDVNNWLNMVNKGDFGSFDYINTTTPPVV